MTLGPVWPWRSPCPCRPALAVWGAPLGRDGVGRERGLERARPSGGHEPAPATFLPSDLSAPVPPAPQRVPECRHGSLGLRRRQCEGSWLTQPAYAGRSADSSTGTRDDAAVANTTTRAWPSQRPTGAWCTAGSRRVARFGSGHRRSGPALRRCPGGARTSWRAAATPAVRRSIGGSWRRSYLSQGGPAREPRWRRTAIFVPTDLSAPVRLGPGQSGTGRYYPVPPIPDRTGLSPRSPRPPEPQVMGSNPVGRTTQLATSHRVAASRDPSRVGCGQAVATMRQVAVGVRPRAQGR